MSKRVSQGTTGARAPIAGAKSSAASRTAYAARASTPTPPTAAPGPGSPRRSVSRTASSHPKYAARADEGPAAASRGKPEDRMPCRQLGDHGRMDLGRSRERVAAEGGAAGDDTEAEGAGGGAGSIVGGGDCVERAAIERSGASGSRARDARERMTGARILEEGVTRRTGAHSAPESKSQTNRWSSCCVNGCVVGVLSGAVERIAGSWLRRLRRRLRWSRVRRKRGRRRGGGGFRRMRVHQHRQTWVSRHTMLPMTDLCG